MDHTCRKGSMTSNSMRGLFVTFPLSGAITSDTTSISRVKRTLAICMLRRLLVAWRSAAQTMTRISRQQEKLFQCLVFRQKMIPKETERNGTRVFQMYLRTQWVKRHAFVTGLKRSRSTRTTGRREKLFNIVEYIALFL